MKNPNQENRKKCLKLLKRLKISTSIQFGSIAMIANCIPETAERLMESGLFLGAYKNTIRKETTKELSTEQINVIDLWNASFSAEFSKLCQDETHFGKKWSDKAMKTPGPFAKFFPEDFKQKLIEILKIDEKTLLKKYSGKKPQVLKGKAFVDYEKKLAKKLGKSMAYNTARIAYYLSPVYQLAILDVSKPVMQRLHEELEEPECWRLEGENSVGIVFVESSRNNGPKFTDSNRNLICLEVLSGLEWLANFEPKANVSWVIDIQNTRIDVRNQSGDPDEAYWRNPAMGQVSYNGNTYEENWSAVGEYREDLRTNNHSLHGFVIFVTPYGNWWAGYASGGRITLADKDDWGGWGRSKIDKVISHEVCHLYGAPDEYGGEGTPCSTCGSIHGCYDGYPNGNCEDCAQPYQDCMMGRVTRRMCGYTQGHLGWGDLLVELTTSNTSWAGTDDTVWLDIGDKRFKLDTPNHNDRERGNVESYSLNYTGLQESDIKRIGIRKSSGGILGGILGGDGFLGGWKLKRVRVWFRGHLLCDNNNINKWLQNDDRWWVSDNCRYNEDIVNDLRVEVRTGNARWSGTDDTVTMYLGGKSYNLDKFGHNDRERGNTDVYKLYPKTGLYRSNINSVRIHKSPDGFAGGWKLRGLKIYTNGVQIYNNQNIKKWLHDNDRDWETSI